MIWVHVSRFDFRGKWRHVVFFNMNLMYICIQTRQLYPQQIHFCLQ